jgi:hypothetical protein
MGLHAAQCPRTTLSIYGKHFRGALESLPSKFRIRPTLLNCARFAPATKTAYLKASAGLEENTHTHHDSRKQFALEMLSCTEEDETFLNRICF